MKINSQTVKVIHHVKVTPGNFSLAVRSRKLWILRLKSKIFISFFFFLKKETITFIFFASTLGCSCLTTWQQMLGVQFVFAAKKIHISDVKDVINYSSQKGFVRNWITPQRFRDRRGRRRTSSSRVHFISQLWLWNKNVSFWLQCFQIRFKKTSCESHVMSSYWSLTHTHCETHYSRILSNRSGLGCDVTSTEIL